MTRSEEPLYALQVGDRAHRIAAATVRRGLVPDRAQRAVTILGYAEQVFADHPVEYRSRAAFLAAVTAAGVYVHRFLPPPPWALVGGEIVSGGCRFDLVYEHPTRGVLVDELKLGVGRAGETSVRDQIDRYLVEGERVWDRRFVGVRLCSVHEPARSRLYLPGRKKSLTVAESDLAAELDVR